MREKRRRDYSHGEKNVEKVRGRMKEEENEKEYKKMEE